MMDLLPPEVLATLLSHVATPSKDSDYCWQRSVLCFVCKLWREVVINLVWNDCLDVPYRCPLDQFCFIPFEKIRQLNFSGWCDSQFLEEIPRKFKVLQSLSISEAGPLCCQCFGWFKSNPPLRTLNLWGCKLESPWPAAFLL